MSPLFLLPKVFLAGGASFLGTLQLPEETPVNNHTLMGEPIPAAQVVTRSHWGTPMPPDAKGGYSLIAPIKPKLIEQSLWIPPVSGKRPFADQPVATNTQVVPAPAPALATSTNTQSETPPPAAAPSTEPTTATNAPAPGLPQGDFPLDTPAALPGAHPAKASSAAAPAAAPKGGGGGKGQ